MVTNRRIIEDGGPNFYPTPAWGTKALIVNEQFIGEILEPCCGNGAMAKVLSEAGYIVHSSDLYDRGYGEIIDFFDIHREIPNLVTNPPFSIAEDVLEHAMNFTKQKICLLLRTAFVESVQRYEKFFKNNVPTRIWTFSQRLSMYPEGEQGVHGGGTTSYSWFVWDRQDPSKETKLLWIKPGLKSK